MTSRPRVSRGPGTGRGPSRPRLMAVLVTGAACALAVACIGVLPGGPSDAPVAVPSPVSQRPAPRRPGAYRVLTRDTTDGNGDIFIAPAGGGYPAGPEIVTTTGKVVWFHRLPAGDVATDFRTQTYLGQPVLTWFQSGGQGAHGGPGSQVGPNGPSGTDYIYNDRYQQIATVRAGQRLRDQLSRVPDHARGTPP